MPLRVPRVGRLRALRQAKPSSDDMPCGLPSTPRDATALTPSVNTRASGSSSMGVIASSPALDQPVRPPWLCCQLAAARIGGRPIPDTTATLLYINFFPLRSCLDSVDIRTYVECESPITLAANNDGRVGTDVIVMTEGPPPPDPRWLGAATPRPRGSSSASSSAAPPGAPPGQHHDSQPAREARQQP